MKVQKNYNEYVEEYDITIKKDGNRIDILKGGNGNLYLLGESDLHIGETDEIYSDIEKLYNDIKEYNIHQLDEREQMSVVRQHLENKNNEIRKTFDNQSVFDGTSIYWYDEETDKKEKADYFKITKVEDGFKVEFVRQNKKKDQCILGKTKIVCIKKCESKNYPFNTLFMKMYKRISPPFEKFKLKHDEENFIASQEKIDYELDKLKLENELTTGKFVGVITVDSKKARNYVISEITHRLPEYAVSIVDSNECINLNENIPLIITGVKYFCKNINKQRVIFILTEAETELLNLNSNETESYYNCHINLNKHFKNEKSITLTEWFSKQHQTTTEKNLTYLPKR